MPTSSSEAGSVKLALLIGFATGAAILALPAPAHARGLFGKSRAEVRVEYAATPAPEMPMEAPADGAIYHASYGYAPLTSGTRAAHIGDIVTIALVERTQALKSTSQTMDRSGSVNIKPPPTGPIATALNKFPIDMGSGQKFGGKGDAAQSNQLSGNISVTVAAVYPNGTMLVRGQKQLTLNRGDEQIQISGLIRQSDIDFDNTVQSTRVADARITYTGKGEVARAAAQGWLNRLFSRVNPF